MKKLKKEVTFIYMDAAEKAMYKPIAEEAERRGYITRFTDNKYAKCEIGIYCQHINFPQFSKFSVIMLHDIIQQYSNWPNLWIREPWNKYDIGFLPSNQWVNNWKQCSMYYYANPKIGMYKVGWPKADNYAGIDKEQFTRAFNQKHGLSFNKRTILYAPSWENDGKQNDFVQSMLKLDVNILIKQASVDPEKYKDMYCAIKEMHNLHKDLPQVVMLDPETNIIEAIMASDVLVSDESSTMCEAVMMGIPAVSVSDWLIPDVTPKRFPQCNYDFVFMTEKDNLSSFIQNIIDNYEKTKEEVRSFSERTFGSLGGASKLIMDIIDDCVEGRKIRYESLSPEPKSFVPIKDLVFHISEGTKREVYYNYKQRFRVVSVMWEWARGVKRCLIK